VVEPDHLQPCNVGRTWHMLTRSLQHLLVWKW